ncbi:uncharacterized protein LOC128718568 [Anopheles marshallii]|uniref:uncharacterized protein LOC128718568 n=1 Tax=Anopheles marshallii TaxID=1521116 RepID=UPI00237A5F40|nr:uncharacterized protein LOC128718568 [Anopheles marshallii]
MYPSEEIQLLLIAKMPFELINTKEDLFQWTALDYAFANRYEPSVKHLLTIGAVVDEDTLLQQISSNTGLLLLITGVHFYGTWLNSHEHYKMIANRLHIRSVEYLLNDRHLDVFSHHKELDSLTILEYCSEHNMIGLLIQLVSQSIMRERISTNIYGQMFQIASENNAHDIKTYLVDKNKTLLPRMINVALLITAIKSCISQNQMNPFKEIFHQLCLQRKIHIVDDTDIITNSHAAGDDRIPPLDKQYYPKICCVRSSDNEQLSLPQYDEKDILHEGYLIEALLATAVHEGNMQMVQYIVQKTNTAITNRLIVKVMRLLPKKYDVCHENSMDAFMYLLARTTDLDSIDDEGRNLLHVTAQNGCFFMLHCLIAKGFDPTIVNKRNGWNVFHYVAFNRDVDRTDKILEFLLVKCDMKWFHDLDRLVESDKDALNADTNRNTQSTKKLNKQQHALLAMYVIYSKRCLTDIMCDQEQQEAFQCIREVAQGIAKSDIIRGFR